MTESSRGCPGQTKAAGASPTGARRSFSNATRSWGWHTPQRPAAPNDNAALPDTAAPRPAMTAPSGLKVRLAGVQGAYNAVWVRGRYGEDTFYYGRGAGSLPAELYWELLDANDQGVVTLGASYNRGGAGGTYQCADVLYYASGGYYVALTLHQMWPVTVDGKPSTLVWRGDMISSAELGSLHGVERLGSESVMMKNITKAVTAFRRETGGR